MGYVRAREAFRWWYGVWCLCSVLLGVVSVAQDPFAVPIHCHDAVHVAGPDRVAPLVLQTRAGHVYYGCVCWG